jgi:hypothetical protein
MNWYTKVLQIILPFSKHLSIRDEVIQFLCPILTAGGAFNITPRISLCNISSTAQSDSPRWKSTSITTAFVHVKWKVKHNVYQQNNFSMFRLCFGTLNTTARTVSFYTDTTLAAIRTPKHTRRKTIPTIPITTQAYWSARRLRHINRLMLSHGEECCHLRFTNPLSTTAVARNIDWLIQCFRNCRAQYISEHKFVRNSLTKH